MHCLRSVFLRSCSEPRLFLSFVRLPQSGFFPLLTPSMHLERGSIFATGSHSALAFRRIGMQLDRNVEMTAAAPSLQTWAAQALTWHWDWGNPPLRSRRDGPRRGPSTDRYVAESPSSDSSSDDDDDDGVSRGFAGGGYDDQTSSTRASETASANDAQIADKEAACVALSPQNNDALTGGAPPDPTVFYPPSTSPTTVVLRKSLIP